ncbi:MAG: dephospho-CoA kinase [Acidimicrobiia bacterium]|nr:dephospho-CoA kinase [Acidimicrobiia bacterium]
MSPAARALLGGGIGSGKSTVAAIFASWGAQVFSADAAAHAVLEPGGAAATAVAARWPGVVAAGRIDRRALAQVVFNDAEARAALEAMTHPAIGRLLAGWVAPVTEGVVLVEMPLPVDLLGPGWRWVVVDAPDDVRLARLTARGLTEGDARRRMAAQPSRDEWQRRADLVVDNGSGLDHLEGECRRAWKEILGWQGAGGGSVAP